MQSGLSQEDGSPTGGGLPAPGIDRPFKAGRYYLAGCAFYLLLVVYGSLVPLDYRRVPFDQAWTIFSQTVGADLERLLDGQPMTAALSRSDVVANFALFVPLSFLAMGTVTRGGQVRWGLVLAVLVLPALTAFGAAVEFLQIYFPPRNPSLRDVLVQSGGSGLGIVLWAVFGRAFTRYVYGLTHYTTLSRPGVQLLGGYLVGLFLYQLVPFNLTLSPKEMIYDKLQGGQINLIPFADKVGWSLYIAFAKFALLVPVGAFFALWRPKARFRAALGLGLLYSAGTELAQLMVVERFTSVTDVVLGTGGCLLGAVLVSLMAAPAGRAAGEAGPGSLDRPDTFWSRWGWEIKFCLTVGYIAIMALLHWWPLDFHSPPRSLLKEAWAALYVPFRNLYFQHPFQAFTNIARDVGWFFVMGLLLRSLWPNRSAAGFLVSLVLVAGLAGGIELVQVFVSRVPDVTSIILGTAGGLAAILCQPFLARMFSRGL